MRLNTVGLSTDGAYELPITQAELADTVGLTHIHVNRILQRLRSEGSITLKSRQLVILDVHKLMASCDFDANYLHLGERNGKKEPCR